MFVNKSFGTILTENGHRLCIRIQNTMTGTSRLAVVPEGLITMKQVKAFCAGEMVQSAFPSLNSYEREYILSGMNQAEQDRYYGASPDGTSIRFDVHDRSDLR